MKHCFFYIFFLMILPLTLMSGTSQQNDTSLNSQKSLPNLDSSSPVLVQKSNQMLLLEAKQINQQFYLKNPAPFFCLLKIGQEYKISDKDITKQIFYFATQTQEQKNMMGETLPQRFLILLENLLGHPNTAETQKSIDAYFIKALKPLYTTTYENYIKVFNQIPECSSLHNYPETAVDPEIEKTIKEYGGNDSHDLICLIQVSHNFHISKKNIIDSLAFFKKSYSEKFGNNLNTGNLINEFVLNYGKVIDQSDLKQREHLINTYFGENMLTLLKIDAAQYRFKESQNPTCAENRRREIVNSQNSNKKEER